ncbi:MAG: hypothetical protein EZS28_020983 [Streblomastix strix]|uniref:Uncharacterized protein n=1 Tax=Streblomastix strix TaxID=222440 RepID=A0A5J4VLM6_9EUKA|nr:MAG: hypothetical protein EZS28_020983 [Streblomastix strix]
MRPFFSASIHFFKQRFKTSTRSKFDKDIEAGKIFCHLMNSCRSMRKIGDITLEWKIHLKYYCIDFQLLKSRINVIYVSSIWRPTVPEKYA